MERGRATHRGAEESIRVRMGRRGGRRRGEEDSGGERREGEETGLRLVRAEKEGSQREEGIWGACVGTSGNFHLDG
jgi:hypothetical protein